MLHLTARPGFASSTTLDDRVQQVEAAQAEPLDRSHRWEGGKGEAAGNNRYHKNTSEATQSRYLFMGVAEGCASETTLFSRRLQSRSRFRHAV